MRLINATTFKLEIFNDESNLPAYAILSHRWIDGEEVLFQDFQTLDSDLWNLFNSFVPNSRKYLNKRRNSHLRGWTKIEKCCQQAVKDGLNYIWVDTCCIDKASSAELSEAINSMFRWYANAQICYAYLSDYSHASSIGWETTFAKSSWFERAWTLQELIAPTSVIFFDQSWNTIGSRSDLCEEIAEASGISHLELFTMKRPDLNNWSIAQRFSWASGRKATRTEDLAYSLLGIFDVNLPLLYGEGTKAFQRLQEAIVQQSSDQTIFAWSGSKELSDFTSIFAPSAVEFSKDHNLCAKIFDNPSPTSLSNLGLTMNVHLQFWTRDIAWAGLNCTQNGFDQVGIFIFRNARTAGVWHKCRVKGKFWHAISRNDPKGKMTSVTVATKLSLPLLERAWPTPQALTHGLPALLVGHRIKKYDLAGLPVPEIMRDLNGKDVTSRIGLKRTQIEVTELGKLKHSTDDAITVETNMEFFTLFGGRLFVVEYLYASSVVKALMAGFDSDLRPFCILAEPHHTGYNKETKVVDVSMDRSLSLHLKSFWQCTGLEEDGWIYSQNGLIQHPSDSMQPGLWGIKGDVGKPSKFLLNFRDVRLTFHFAPLRYHFGVDRTLTYNVTMTERPE